MKRKHLVLFLGIFIFLTLALILASSVVAFQRYAMIKIGSSEEECDWMPEARSINNLGQVVGSAPTPSCNGSFAFIWEDDTMTSVAGPSSAATAINNLNQIALYNPFPIPYLWDDSVLTDLEPLEWYWLSSQFLNDHGQVVGYVDVGDDHAFIWEDGNLTDISLPGTEDSYATAINNSGQVSVNIGKGSDRDRAYPAMWDDGFAYIWQNGNITHMETLEGATYSHAADINDLGQVVGWSEIPGAFHAFMWEDGQVTDLLVPGSYGTLAEAINNMGQIVGRFGFGGFRPHAMIWESGDWRDLNDLVPKYAGYELIEAIDINDSGQIICRAAYQRTTEEWSSYEWESELDFSFLLTPIQEAMMAFAPVADARVWTRYPNGNYGEKSTLIVDLDEARESYLKFNVSGITTGVTEAKLRLYCTNGSNQGGIFYTTNNLWEEDQITYNNKPDKQDEVGSLGSVQSGMWYEIDVTDVVTKDGTYSFCVASNSSNGAGFYSKEGELQPELVVKADQTSNESPEASFIITNAASGIVRLGTELEVDASNSHDPDGDIVNYHWDFGNGSSDSIIETSGPIAHYEYKNTGSYEVVLTVTDDYGATDKSWRTIFISDGETAMTYNPVADTTVRTKYPDRNYGEKRTLIVDLSEEKEFYLKFNLAGITADVREAKIRLYCTNGSNQGGIFHTTPTGWFESTITWNRKPDKEDEIGRLGPVQSGAWYEFDVSDIVKHGFDAYSFSVSSDSINGAGYYSKEGEHQPELVVKYWVP